MKRTFRYRLYPTRRQAEALEQQLGFACDLYNAALEQRRDWWKRGRRTSWVGQGQELTQLRRAGGALDGMSFNCQEKARCEAVVGTFRLAAYLTEREGRSYGEWVTAVTEKFKRIWKEAER